MNVLKSKKMEKAQLRSAKLQGRRLLFALLCSVFLSSMLPGVSLTAAAEQAEVSADVYDEMGLSREAEQTVDLEEQPYPYGNGIANLNPIKELCVTYAGWSGLFDSNDINGMLFCDQDSETGSLMLDSDKSSGFLKLYGSEADFQGQLGYYSGPGAITGTGPANLNFLNQSWINKSSEKVKVASVAYNDGDGRDSMLAEVSFWDNGSNNLQRLKIYTDEIVLGTISPVNAKKLKRWEPDAFLEIEAGDFDGNGKDEMPCMFRVNRKYTFILSRIVI